MQQLIFNQPSYITVFEATPALRKIWISLVNFVFNYMLQV